jgi:glycerol kinase
MEAACFQTKAILDAMEMDSGKKLTELAVDGGMSNSDICMQVRFAFPSPFLIKSDFSH